MAYHPYDAKPSPEPMITYNQLNPREQHLVKSESKYNNIYEEITFENTCWTMAIF